MLNRSLFIRGFSMLVLLSASLSFVSLTAQAQSDPPPAFCSGYPPAPASGQWQSSRVFYSSGRLTYATDSEGNRIPDYSYAGYRYGQGSIPSIPQVMTLSPASGDNTARIQAALDQVGARTPDANGIRGALVLAPGVYEIRGTLRINRSGVVLRGDGDGGSSSSDTILRATGDTPHQRSVVILGSGTNSWPESGATNITTSIVRVGAMSFDVASASGYSAGDDIVIHHPSTQAWIDAIDGGGTVDAPPFSPGSVDIIYYRKITRISGNTITVDAPVYNHLNRSLSQSYIAHVNAGAITNAAVENLRIDIVTAGGEDENHAWTALYVQGAQDSWVRGVTALHFGYAGVRLENAVRVTVEDCHALDPVGVRTGGRFYNFSSDRRANLILFKFCEATNARHSYISNGVSLASGLVYYRCSQLGGGSEGGHRMWATGVLYDNIDEQGDGQVLLINRGDFGSGHGWAAAHSTIWKYDGELVVQKPPTAQNYGITNQGHFRPTFYFPGPAGHQELRTGDLVPFSLYEAQLCERLSGSTPPPTSFNGFYRIMARHSGKAVVVQGASTADGADVIQWTYGGSNTNDEWEIISVGGGFFRIMARHSGKAMVVQSASTAEGADVIQWTYGGSNTNDEWAIESLGGGFYRIINRNSGKVLEVLGSSTSDGADVVQRTWNGGANQQFQIISVP
jgi:Ricin-type beta-trefoil lectin domain-like